jgi:hypothetical protein
VKRGGEVNIDRTRRNERTNVFREILNLIFFIYSKTGERERERTRMRIEKVDFRFSIFKTCLLPA